MFGKQDPVVTEKDVGDFVKQLHNDGQPLKDIIAEVSDEGVAKTSKRTPTRTQVKNSLYGVRNSRQKSDNKP